MEGARPVTEGDPSLAAGRSIEPGRVTNDAVAAALDSAPA